MSHLVLTDTDKFQIATKKPSNRSGRARCEERETFQYLVGQSLYSFRDTFCICGEPPLQTDSIDTEEY
jgi:hypothetical protein